MRPSDAKSPPMPGWDLGRSLAVAAGLVFGVGVAVTVAAGGYGGVGREVGVVVTVECGDCRRGRIGRGVFSPERRRQLRLQQPSPAASARETRCGLTDSVNKVSGSCRHFVKICFTA